MKILFLTEQFPFPLHDGGNLRTFHVLAGLAEAHDVTLVAHTPPNGQQVLDAFPIDCCVRTIDKPGVTTRILKGLQHGGQGGRSIFLTKNWSSRLLAAADLLVQQSRFDVIHFNHLDTACYALTRNWKPMKVFDTHNCLSAMASQVSENATTWWRRRLFAYEARQLKDVESAVCRQMNQNLMCSDVDADIFRKLCPNLRCRVVPNGVDTNYFRRSPLVPEEDGAVVFTGAMNYFPNEHGAQFFGNQVLPRMKTANAKVYLVGRRPSAAVRSLHDGQRIMVTGEVPDVRPYVDRSQVFVAPLHHGSGTRLKILEAFAMGKAVVSTSVGAEGIPATNGRHLILADSSEQFASSVDSLLMDEQRRRAMGIAAREFVVTKFDWNNIQADVREMYLQLARTARAA